MPSSADQVETMEIEGTPEACYGIICDFASYPEWQSVIKKVKIRKKDADGRPAVVEYHVGIMGRTIRYVLRYAYDDSRHELTWTYVEGDVKDTHGSYTFKKKGAKKTLATYTLFVDIGFWIPQMVANTLTQIGMIDSMKDLKRRVENG